jgi:outer membrane protein assembly factor BamE (lipoprotein component of BamABCDE complex)
MRRAGLVAGVALAALAVCSGCGCGLVRDGSEYATGFSEERFARVAPGMTEAEVLALLGPPLGEDSGRFHETWEYSPRGGLRRFFAGPRDVVLDDAGRVQEVAAAFQGRVSAGMTAAEVLERLGAPGTIRSAYAKRAWHSHQLGDASFFRLRAVHYDADAKVVGIESRLELD